MFRSITVVTAHTGRVLNPSLRKLEEWLIEYNSLFVQETGAAEQRNLHLLYGRTVSLFGDILLKSAVRLVRFAEACKRIGFCFQIQLDVLECLQHMAILQRLVSSDCSGSLILNASEKGVPRYLISRIEELIKVILDQGWSLTLVGPLQFWRSTGIFETETLNGRNFAYVPSSSWSESFGVGEPESQFSARPIVATPCEARFELYIAPDGLIFPCRGLIGLNEYAIGSIWVSASRPMPLLAPNQLDLVQLASRGPEIPNGKLGPLDDSLPLICAAHRAWIRTKTPPVADTNYQKHLRFFRYGNRMPTCRKQNKFGSKKASQR